MKRLILILILILSITLVGCNSKANGSNNTEENIEIDESGSELTFKSGETVNYKKIYPLVYHMEEMESGELFPIKIDEKKERAIADLLETMILTDEESGLDSAYEEGSIILQLVGEDKTYNIDFIEEKPYHGDNMYWYSATYADGTFAGVFKTEADNDLKEKLADILEIE